MTTYKFICESERDAWGKAPANRVEYTVEEPDLSDMLEAFHHFMRGCGWTPEGTLDFVDDSLDDETEA